MIRVRKGNDILVQWSITDRATGAPYPLDPSRVRLFVSYSFRREEIEDFTVGGPGGNVVSWAFPGADQRILGEYGLTLEERRGGDLVTVDSARAFKLVSRSSSTHVEGGEDAVAVTVVGVTSQVGQSQPGGSGGGASYTFDASPRDGSANPVTSDGVYEADRALGEAVEAVRQEVSVLSQSGGALGQQVQSLGNALAAKQDKLVSSITLKTVNGETLLGAGNIEIGDGTAGGSGAGAPLVLYFLEPSVAAVKWGQTTSVTCRIKVATGGSMDYCTLASLPGFSLRCKMNGLEYQTVVLPESGMLSLGGLVPYTASSTFEFTLHGPPPEGSEVGPVLARTLVPTVSDGEEGAGGKGVVQETISYAASWSGSTIPSGSGVWKSTIAEAAPQKGQYLWIRRIVTYSDNTSSPATYSLTYFGTDGAPGTPGTPGEPGEPGRGIAGTVIRYAASNSGSAPPSQSSPSWKSDITLVTAQQGQYLWTWTRTTYTDGTWDDSYTVAYNGSDGSDGTAGADGQDGLNIATVTLYQAWPRGVFAHEVLPVEGASYGFEPAQDGYWESTNQGVSSSASVCVVSVELKRPGKVYIEGTLSAEHNGDNGYLGKVNVPLSPTSAYDGSYGVNNFKRELDCAADVSGDPVELEFSEEYSLPAGTSAIHVKYRKDGSVHKGYDKLRFKVRCALTDVPHKPAFDMVYTFATDGLNGAGDKTLAEALNGWSQLRPQLGEDPIWMTSAGARGREDTCLIPVNAWSEPVVSAQRGEKGSSPASPFRGEWSAAKTYYGNSNRRDVVLVSVTDPETQQVSKSYYIASIGADALFGGADGFTGKSPATERKYWEPFGASYESIATGFLFAEQGVVEDLTVGKVLVKDSDNNILAKLDATGVQVNTGEFSDVSVSGDLSANSIRLKHATPNTGLPLDGSFIYLSDTSKTIVLPELETGEVMVVEAFGLAWTRLDKIFSTTLRGENGNVTLLAKGETTTSVYDYPQTLNLPNGEYFKLIGHGTQYEGTVWAVMRMFEFPPWVDAQ